MKNLLLSITAAAALYSCTAVPAGNTKLGKAQLPLLNTQWVLADAVKGKAPTLVIENGKISGNGICNRYFGNLTLDATVGNFNISQIGSTKMACDKLSTEVSYFQMLDEADKYIVSGNTLELYKGNLLLMKFNKQ